MRERKRQRMRKTKRILLTLNEPLVPTMPATSYALWLPGTWTNTFPFMLRLSKEEFLLSERSMTNINIQDDYLHSPKENSSFIITKPWQRS